VLVQYHHRPMLCLAYERTCTPIDPRMPFAHCQRLNPSRLPCVLSCVLCCMLSGTLTSTASGRQSLGVFAGSLSRFSSMLSARPQFIYARCSNRTAPSKHAAPSSKVKVHGTSIFYLSPTPPIHLLNFRFCTLDILCFSSSVNP
jgi:hypothetical protein